MRNALQSNVLHLYSEKYNSVTLLYMLSKKDGKTATIYAYRINDFILYDLRVKLLYTICTLGEVY